MHLRPCIAALLACYLGCSSDPAPDPSIDAGPPGDATGDASLACTSNAECTPGYECSYPAVMGCVPGTCEPDEGGNCGGGAVCGCDGVTYASGCELLTAGVKRECNGACPCP